MVGMAAIPLKQQSSLRESSGFRKMATQVARLERCLVKIAGIRTKDLQELVPKGIFSVSERDLISISIRTFFSLVAAQEKSRLAIGILLGVSFEALRLGFVGSYLDAEETSFLASFPSFGSLTLGLIIVFLPLLFQKPKVTEDERALLATVEELMEKGKLSSAERRLAYRHILQKYVDASGPNFSKRSGVEISDVFEIKKLRE